MAKPLTILRFMICCKVLFIFQFFKSSNAQLLRRVLAKVFPIEVDFLLLSVNWKKVNPDPTGVCFEAQLNDHSFGVFKIKERGLIYSFKLVLVSGKLSCSKYFPSSYWGCTHWSYWDKKLLTVITYPNKTALPLAQYRGQSDACRFYSYKIHGVGVNSAELLFNKLPSPVTVSPGQDEFHIWYGEALSNCGWEDNYGTACVDVYAWYA